jgi:hypothetical protein
MFLHQNAAYGEITYYAAAAVHAQIYVMTTTVSKKTIFKHAAFW